MASGALVLLLTSCSLLPGAMKAAIDGEWLLQAGTSHGVAIPIAPGHRITLKIDGSKVGGSAACNSYGGKLVISPTGITINELIQTEMACVGNDVMASEAAYLAALPAVTTAARDGDGLVLTGPQVELRFVPVPQVADASLVGTVWVLESLLSGDVASSTVGAQLTLQLKADGSVAGSTGCRSFSGRYTVSGNDVQVTLHPMDMIACASALGDQDAHVLAVISHSFSVSIDGNLMTLTAGDKGLGYLTDAPGS